MNALQENDILVHVLLREVGRYDAQQPILKINNRVNGYGAEHQSR